MPSARVILHLDMDAFFASVEQRDFPELRGKPVLVGGGRGGEGKRGVVTTASYEARVFGCRSAMPMAQARRLCPQAIVQPVRMDVYSQASDLVMDIVRELSPLVQPVSIDEAFAELSGVLHLHGCPPGATEAKQFEVGKKIAREIKALVRKRLNLPCSVGLGPNRSLAKIASDMGKPDGLAVIEQSRAIEILGPMKVGVLYTLGPKTQAILEARGVRTVADLRKMGQAAIEREFGESGRFWWDLAHGRDEREVHAERDDAKSISKERTFSEDVGDPVRLHQVLASQVEDSARRLRAEGLKSRRVTLKLRLGDFSTFTRSRTLDEATDQTKELLAAARSIFDDWLAEKRGAVRLVGAGLGELTKETQLELFAPPAAEKKASKTDAVADAIIERFGRGAILRGGSLENPDVVLSKSNQNAKNRRDRKL